MQYARLFVAVDGSEFKEAQRKFTIGTLSRLENKVVEGAVHRLHVVLLAGALNGAIGMQLFIHDHRWIHALRIPIKVARLLKERCLC